MHIGWSITAFAVLVWAATAAAAGGGSVTTTLSPNKVSKASTLTVTAEGPFTGLSGAPKSVVLKVQKGFKSSAKSVPVLCTRTQANNNACPSESKVGSGQVVATGSFGPIQQQDMISLTMFLGTRQKQSDVASVVIVGTDSLAHQTVHGVGRLFAVKHGGLELLFNQFPNVSVPAGTTVTLDSLQLMAGATRTVKRHRHKVRYSLISNPPACNGPWSGSLKLTFTSGTFSRALSAPCRTH